MPFGQHQDTELWNNQFPETKILGLPVSQGMRGLVYLESRGEVDVNTFHKDIQYALEILESRNLALKERQLSNFKSKRNEGSGNELVDYSRAPCRGADQKVRGLWERDCKYLCRNTQPRPQGLLLDDFSRWRIVGRRPWHTAEIT